MQSHDYAKYLRINKNVGLMNAKQEKLTTISCIYQNFTKFFWQYTNFAIMTRDKTGLSRDKTGTSSDKKEQAGTKQGQTGINRDIRDKIGTVWTKQGQAGTKQGHAGTKQGQGHNWTNSSFSSFCAKISIDHFVCAKQLPFRKSAWLPHCTAHGLNGKRGRRRKVTTPYQAYLRLAA